MGWLIASIICGIEVFIMLALLLGNPNRELIPSLPVIILIFAVIGIICYRKYEKIKRPKTGKWALDYTIYVLNIAYNIMSKTKNFKRFRYCYKLARKKLSILKRQLDKMKVDKNIFLQWEAKIESCFESKYDNFLDNSIEYSEQERLEIQYFYCINRIDNMGSEPVEISDKEEIFIKALLTALNTMDVTRHLQISRISDKTLNFCYDGAQIGRIQLQDRKTRMQVMNMDLKENHFGIEWFEDLSLNEYIQKIQEWNKSVQRLS